MPTIHHDSHDDLQPRETKLEKKTTPLSEQDASRGPAARVGVHLRPLIGSDRPGEGAPRGVRRRRRGGGLVRAPRKPTNHSKSTGADADWKHYKVKAEKGRYKFKHDEIKTYLRDLLDGDDDGDGADYE
ncbi:unnamed protein product [Urochloa humidicola]